MSVPFHINQCSKYINLSLHSTSGLHHHDLFVTEFNIYLGYPRSDTCDSIVARIGDAPSPSVEMELKQQLEIHKKIAQKGYQAFRYDQELSKQSWEKVNAN